MLARFRSFIARNLTRSFDAAAGGRRWRGAIEMRQPLPAMQAARGPLAARARALVANNPLAASGADAWVAALIGTGIKPQSRHRDQAAREQLNLNWEAWTDVADADGLTDAYGLEALLTRRMVIDGEAFAVMSVVDGALRIRIIDPEQVDPSLNRDLGEGRRIVAGIEFDGANRRVAYHILRDRPGLPFGAQRFEPIRTPTEDVIHLFRPDVAGQVRGVSWFAPVMLRLADLDSWRDAQLMRQKVAAMLAAFVVDLNGNGKPFDGDADGRGSLIGGLEPAMIKFLDPGQDIRFSEPANIGAEVIDFAKITEREIAVGLGVPAAALTGDLTQANYGSIRAGKIEFQRRVEALQHSVIVFQACRPMWRRFATLEVLSGHIRSTVDACLPAVWIPPKNDWIDPQKDVEAEKMAIDAGLMSRRQAVTARGVDIEALDREIADDNARAARLKLTFNAPARPARAPQPEPAA